MATFPLELVTPERLLFSEQVQAVRAPGIDGSFGVLAHHAPLLAELSTGMIKITLPGGQEEFIATTGGFMQVSREKVIILADAAELSTEIDVERARQALERARQMLAIPGELSSDEVREMIDRAQNRLRVAQMRSGM
jgi:F-type H+-transporting ATPase subunit epsilon